MFIRMRAFLIGLIAVTIGASTALAQAPAQPARPDPNAPVLTENFDDWSLRCFNVRGPAPCDLLQVAVNKQNQQRVLSVSLAYVPERNAYAMQMILPLGVTLSKGMTLNAGPRTLKNVHFTRCTRDGCYIEVVVDGEVVSALSKVGASTMIVVYPYGRTTDAKLPLSLKGFGTAVARLKVLATQRATRSQGAPAQGPAPAPAPVAPAPAPAVPHPAAPAPAPH